MLDNPALLATYAPEIWTAAPDGHVPKRQWTNKKAPSAEVKTE